MGNLRKQINTLKLHSKSIAIISKITGCSGYQWYNMPSMQDHQQQQSKHHMSCEWALYQKLIKLNALAMCLL
jgi:hypothetical protein